VDTPEVLPGVRAEQRFGDLKVIRTGVRGGHCASNPRGWPAAECECRCGKTGVVPLYRLLNGNTKSCGHGACYRPRRGVRDAIIDWLGETGGAYMMQVRDHFGLTDGSAGGHLSYLAKSGRLERPVRGFYCLPGKVPDPIPPLPPEVFSSRSSKAGKARWKNLDQAGRDKAVRRLTAARVAAAERRQDEVTGAAAGDTG
jgi:hypothetical protein